MLKNMFYLGGTCMRKYFLIAAGIMLIFTISCGVVNDDTLFQTRTEMLTEIGTSIDILSSDAIYNNCINKQNQTEEIISVESTISSTDIEIISIVELTEAITTAEPTEPPTTTILTTEAPIVTQLPTEPVYNNIFSIIHDDFVPSDNLINEINKVIRNDKFRTGFYLKSLDGTLEMECNSTYQYYGDSTIKTAVALYVYKEVTAGRVNLDTYIGEEKISDLVCKMLEVSDNPAYHTLRNYFGRDKINNLTSSLGCKTFKISNEWANATPKDAGILWEGVYKFYNNSGEIGELFMSQLVNALWNAVSESLDYQYTIPHKYGYNNDVFAENSLILKDEGSSYIFTYYTLGSYNNNNLKQIIIILDEMMKEYDIYLK